ncbi:CC90B protein, partial [Polyodon spathula]|nr:CC90B protein [Polyodon spathula]
MAHLDAIRKDMVILEKSEFANLRAENEVTLKERNCFVVMLVQAELPDTDTANGILPNISDLQSMTSHVSEQLRCCKKKKKNHVVV